MSKSELRAVMEGVAEVLRERDAKVDERFQNFHDKMMEHERRIDANKRHCGNLESKLAEVRDVA